MKTKSLSVLESVGFDMTPMIDCVFQLIIFFMLTVDFANTQLARVTLPKAVTASEDKPPEERLIVNLEHPDPYLCKELEYDNNGNLIKPCSIETHWKITVNGKEFTPEELKDYLIIEGGKYQGREVPKGKEKLGVSNRPLMIRADAGAIYKIVEKVLSACSQARIWRIEIGA